jgi:hypothetical protein
VSRGCAFVIISALAAAPAAAQTRYLAADQPRLGTIEADAGVVWSGGVTLGSAPANLTNNPGSGSGSFVLFQTDTRITGATAFDAAVDVFLSRQLALEAGLQVGQPSLTISDSADTESAPPVTATSSLTQYLITGSAVYYVGGGGRFQPFVEGGGGYLRQVLEGGSVIETGNELHAGGGVRYWFTASRRVGVRADVRASLQSGGVSFDDKRRTIPQGGAALAWRF